jgi:hypothetical protein
VVSVTPYIAAAAVMPTRQDPHSKFENIHSGEVLLEAFLMPMGSSKCSSPDSSGTALANGMSHVIVKPMRF